MREISFVGSATVYLTRGSQLVTIVVVEYFGGNTFKNQYSRVLLNIFFGLPRQHNVVRVLPNGEYLLGGKMFSLRLKKYYWDNFKYNQHILPRKNFQLLERLPSSLRPLSLKALDFDVLHFQTFSP